MKQAVVVAVEAAVRELLASAELQRRLRPEPESKPGFVRRAASALCRGVVSVAKGCWSCAAALVGHCRAKASRGRLGGAAGPVVVVDHVRRGMTAFARQVWLGWFIAAGMVRRFRKPLLVAAAVGAALAVACYLAGPAVSSLVNGVAGFLGALVAGMLVRLRPLAPRHWLGRVGCRRSRLGQLMLGRRAAAGLTVTRPGGHLPRASFYPCAGGKGSAGVPGAAAPLGLRAGPSGPSGARREATGGWPRPRSGRSPRITS